MLWAFRMSKQLSMGSFLMERIFWSTPNGVLMANTEWLPGIQYHLRSTHRGLWGLVVFRLLWLSARALAAQARGVLGSTPSNCRLFHFPLFLPHNISIHLYILVGFFFLFQTGGSFIPVILHKISTTGTRSSGCNKKRWPSLSCRYHYWQVSL